DDIPWDVEALRGSPDGRHVAFVVNEDGSSRLYLLDQKTLDYRPVDGVPIGQVSGLHFTPDSKRLGFTLDSPLTPGDVFVLDIESGAVERWTESEIGGLNTAGFVEPELIRYPTFDKDDAGKQRHIPAFVYKPQSSGPHPVLISIHGGPESQY